MASKVAVLVTGIFPDYLPRWKLMECLNRIHNAFPKCDFYYQSWDEDLHRYVLYNSGVIYNDIKWFEQPTIDYNPYELAMENDIFTDFMKDKMKNVMRAAKEEGKAAKIQFRTMQQLGFHYLWETIEEKYDYYYRVRWDTWMSDKFDLKKSLDLVDQYVVGYNTVVTDEGKYPDFPWRLKYDRVRIMRQTIANWVESGKYELITEDDEKRIIHYNNFLSDFCMGFKREDYTGNVVELSDAGKLYPAEWGWHQILCGSREHVNVDGLCSIYRNVDDSLQTFEKLRHLGIR